MTGFAIRQARPEDEAALYEVCLKTGRSGEDATDLYRDDPRALGHVYAGPYLRLEPELALVLEDAQGVCGYALGALDSRSYYARYLSEWLPPLRARIADPAGDPAMWTAAQRCHHQLHHPAPFVPAREPEFPAHLHIDLLPRAQGQGNGRRLMSTLLARMAARGSPGVHLGVGLANARAIAFYEKLGFEELERTPDALWMGKRLGASALDRYHEAARAQLDQVMASQRARLATAAGWIADALAAERWLYLFGTGHSHLLAAEAFYRAGGLARASAILHEPLMLHESAALSSELECQEGYAAHVLEGHPLGAGDVLVVASSSGRNPVPIELALAAKARGTRTIGITNRRHAAAAPSRHSSGKKLADVVDLALDNCGVPGDAAVQLDGLEPAVGPTSTITGAFLVNGLVVQAVEELLARGVVPEVWSSANLGAGERNKQLLARYRGRVRHL